MRKIILSLFAMASASVWAQQPLTGDVQVNTTPLQIWNDGESSVKEMPIISINEAGKTTIVWSQKLAMNAQYKVYNRAYDENDNALSTGQNVVNNSPPATQGFTGDRYTRVASDNAGNYIIVYMENSSNSVMDLAYQRVYFHRYFANGTPNGARVFVSDGMFPDIDIAPDGSFNISYVRGHYYLATNAVYVRRFSPTGTAIGGPITIDTYTDNTNVGYYDAHIRSKNGNIFTVCYQRGNMSNSVTVKTYNGTTNTSSTIVDGFVRTRNFIEKPDGKIVATSLRKINNSNNTYTYKATTSRFGINSALQQQDLSTTTGNTFHLKGNTIGSNLNGDYVIAFPKWTNDIYQGIYLQQYNSTDGAVGSAYPVSTVDNTMEAVSIDVGTCEFTVAWQKADKVFYKRFKLLNFTTVAIEGLSHFCAGNPVNLQVSFPTGSSGISTHSWQIQECTPAGVLLGSPLYTVQGSGVPSSFTFPSNWNLPCNKHYMVKLTAGNTSCPDIAVATKMIFMSCGPQIYPVSNQTICSGSSASFMVSATVWPVAVFANGQLLGSFSSNPITLTPTTTTTYTFQVSDGLKKGCTDSETATVTVQLCPKACFNVNNIIYTQNENSLYGPQPVHRICNTNISIDGRCSENESGYHLRVSKFDLMSWTFTGDLYNNWVSGTGQAGIINLSALIGNSNFQANQVYLVNLSVGNPWNSAVAQFFRVQPCAASSEDGVGTISRDALVSDDSDSSDYLIYPNPTNGNVTLRFGKAATGHITVHSTDGKQVVEKTFSDSPEITIDLSRYATGLYIASITVDGRSVKKKIIKK